MNTMTPSELQELVRRLLAYEAVAGKTPDSSESATLCVYEKLRQSLHAFAGIAAFQALATRALTLARAEAPSLGSLQVAADGSLQTLGESEPRVNPEMVQLGDGGVVLIDHLLGLLVTFLGEALTLSLLRNAWPGASFDDQNSGNGRNA